MKSDASPLVRTGEDRWPEPRPAWFHGLGRTYDWLVQRSAPRHLSGTIGALDTVARVANRSGLHGPSAREVAALYDWLPPRRLGPIARDIAALRLKNRAAVALVRNGLTTHLARLVRWPSDTAWRDVFEGDGARVIIACHVGAFFGIRAALHLINRPALMLRDLPLGDPASRAGALKRAIDHLREGGLVVATLDGPGGTSTREVECLGRRVVLRRGPFMLARITGAPLIPVAAAWTVQRQIAVRIALPVDRPVTGDLTADVFEDVMAARAARWLDDYLRAEPQEIWLSTLRYFLAAHRLTE